MEVVQGKSTDKKIVIAQEIAFAKVLAGNSKTLRDRALKKLKKWLSVRGHGKWVFTEDEFIRIWTGLFYCMWMSDKFLVQEELAENISQLIHCFKKNRESALLFIKCFNKRLLMEYEGLDQYRIDKFNMLIRRFLRQCFMYCKGINWDETFVNSMTGIFSDTVFQKDVALGYVLHFMNIYPEELAKVSEGKIMCKTVLQFIEPFLKLLAKSRDERVQAGVLEFFNYLMNQTDIGIEFEEKFHVWKQLGFPGSGVNSIRREPILNGDEDDSFSEDSDDEGMEYEKPMDPRAGSVHVDLPQIPLDIDKLINLLNKYERAKFTLPKSKKKLRTLVQKFSALKKGKFPMNIKKDLIIDDKIKKPRLTVKTAKNLLKYTEEMNSGPIKSKEFAKISEELEEAENNKSQSDDGNEELNEEEIDSTENVLINGENEIDSDTSNDNESNNDDDDDDDVDYDTNKHKTKKMVVTSFNNKKATNKHIKVQKVGKNLGANDFNEVSENGKQKKQKKVKVLQNGNAERKTDEVVNTAQITSKTKKKRRRKKKNQENKEIIIDSQDSSGVKSKKKPISVNGKATPKEKKKLNGTVASPETNARVEEPKNATTINKKNGVKRKALGDWLVQDLYESDPEYWKLKPQKVIKLDVKPEVNSVPKTETATVPSKTDTFSTPSPVFWDRAMAKVSSNKKKPKSTLYLNPLARGKKSSCYDVLDRRISFALEKNMAQENEEYLEEVRNSPKVPFDGSKKPVQSALKSGLSPSPINPFYRMKKIKF